MSVKRQHFVPRFYLESFKNPRGKAWAYRRGTASKTHVIHEVSLRNVCAENNLYEIPFRSSSERAFIEHGATELALSQMESLFAPSLKYLIEWHPNDLNDPQESLWDHLAIVLAFAANLIVRNPKWIKPQREHATLLMQHLVSKDFFTQCDLNELKKLGYSCELEGIVELSIQHTELFNLDEKSSMMRLIKILNGMSVALLKAPSDYVFITSSFPVIAQWSNEESEDPDWFYFPLSSTSALILHKETQRDFFYSKISAEEVTGLNAHLLSNSLWDTALASRKTTLEECLHSLGHSSHDQ